MNLAYPLSDTRLGGMETKIRILLCYSQEEAFIKMGNNVWKCLKCGSCCIMLSKIGVKVTLEEWEEIGEDILQLNLPVKKVEESRKSLYIPTRGRNGFQKCVFIDKNNNCQIYSRRPLVCRDFPLRIIEGESSISFNIALLCPRSEQLGGIFKRKLPKWARSLVGEKEYSVTLA